MRAAPQNCAVPLALAMQLFGRHQVAALTVAAGWTARSASLAPARPAWLLAARQGLRLARALELPQGLALALAQSVALAWLVWLVWLVWLAWLAWQLWRLQLVAPSQLQAVRKAVA